MDILRTHRQICPSHEEVPTVQFSLDGIQESKSSNTSIDIYCLKFNKCRNVYPIKLIRPNEKYKYNEQEEFANFIEDINNSEIIIDTGVMDNPKRSVARMAKSSSGTCACEYCEASAVSFKNRYMKKSHLTWPPSTMNGRPRTITGIRRIVNSIEEAEEEGTFLPKDYLKGIKGKSVLLHQNNFDLIHDLPTEYMHLVCLGTVKRLVEFSYKLGKNRTRITKRKRSDPKLFNILIAVTEVPREFPRRCRNLDTGVYKALEYRNVILFFFPIVIDNIPQQYKKERQLWLTLAFVVRSCVLPNSEFDHINKATIVSACELFYNLYFELFGQQNCTYSIHVVGSHCLKIRGNVPFTERSAFPFESFYSEMKNLFKAGTTSPLKQILQNTSMKRSIEHHVCEKTIVYNVKSTNSLENDSLIYTINNHKHEFYIITSIDNDEFICNRQGKFEYKTPLLQNYDWKSVGVYRKGPIGPDTFRIPKHQVKGKYLCVLDMLITCPINVLTEK